MELDTRNKRGQRDSPRSPNDARKLTRFAKRNSPAGLAPDALHTATLNPTTLPPPLPQLPDPRPLQDAATNASLLNLMTSMHNKLDELNTTVTATQNDLAQLRTSTLTRQDLDTRLTTLRTDLTQETTQQVTAATAPLKQDVNALTEQLKDLTTTVTTLQQQRNNTATPAAVLSPLRV